MKSISAFKSATALATVLVLTACGNMQYPSSNTSGYENSTPQSNTTSGTYLGTGVVQSIELVRVANTGIGGSGIGAGTIAGAVVGGIVGNQIGTGGARSSATVLGAAGGAYAGHELEKRNQQTTDAYKITVRMRDGSYQTVTQTSNADIRVGDQVQIQNGVAQRY